VVLKAGNAFDVVASRTQTDYRTVSTEPFQVEVAFAVTIRNRRKEPATVTIREPIGGEWKVMESTHPPQKIDAATLGFEVPVSAGAEGDGPLSRPGRVLKRGSPPGVRPRGDLGQSRRAHRVEAERGGCRAARRRPDPAEVARRIHRRVRTWDGC
jgi:hypothetical protein